MNDVFVTGADRNIGFEICRAFLQRGWRVFAGRYNENLHLLDDLRTQNPGHLFIVHADVSSRESLDHAAEEISALGGELDMFVHNAANFGQDMGDVRGKLCVDHAVRPFDINALGAIRVTQAMLPIFKADGLRRLCFVSSEAGSISIQARDFLSDYCMSKAALNMAVRLMFNELRPKGYTFRLFHPGWVKSPEDGVSDVPGKILAKTAGQTAAEQFVSEWDWEDVLAVIDFEGVLWPF